MYTQNWWITKVSLNISRRSNFLTNLFSTKTYSKLFKRSTKHGLNSDVYNKIDYRLHLPNLVCVLLFIPINVLD